MTGTEGHVAWHLAPLLVIRANEPVGGDERENCCPAQYRDPRCIVPAPGAGLKVLRGIDANDPAGIMVGDFSWR
jgi:hypothetical protein